MNPTIQIIIGIAALVLLESCRNPIDDIGNKDPSRRRSAAVRLGAERTPRAITALISALGDDDKSVANTAQASLIQQGRVIGSTLAEALGKARVPSARVRLCSILGEFRDPSSLQPLIEAATNDQDYDARKAAAEALGHFGSQPLQPLLAQLRATREGHYYRYCDIASTIGRLKLREAVDDLTKEYEWHPSNSVGLGPEALECVDQAIGRIGGPEAIDALLHRKYWRSARQALSAIGRPALDKVLQELLLTGDPTAADILGDMGSDSVESVLAIYRDRNKPPNIRLAAARAVSKSGVNDAVNAVLADLDPANLPLVDAIWEYLFQTDKARYGALLMKSLDAKPNGDLANAMLNSTDADFKAAAERYRRRFNLQVIPIPK